MKRFDIKHVVIASMLALSLAGGLSAISVPHHADASLPHDVIRYTNGRDNYFHPSILNKTLRFFDGYQKDYFNGFSNRKALLAKRYRYNEPVGVRDVLTKSGRDTKRAKAVRIHGHKYYMIDYMGSVSHIANPNSDYRGHPFRDLKPNGKLDYYSQVFMSPKDFSSHKLRKAHKHVKRVNKKHHSRCRNLRYHHSKKRRNHIK